MQAFTETEARTWSLDHRLEINRAGDPCFSDQRLTIFRLPLPKEPHRLPYLVLSLLDVKVDESDEVDGDEHLLWMRSWDMWPKLVTSIGLVQFEALRKGLGISESISERPAVLFSHAEIKGLISCALVPLVFGWDCYIIPCSADYITFLSHDEHVEVSAKSDEVQSRLINELGRWNPSRPRNG